MTRTSSNVVLAVLTPPPRGNVAKEGKEEEREGAKGCGEIRV